MMLLVHIPIGGTMINVTNVAADHLKSISDSDPDGKVCRLGVRGGGCAGFSYDWGLIAESDMNKDDETISLYNGSKLIVDGASLMFLIGTTIDLQKNVFGTILEIVNPAAQSSCGCGESINFDMEKVEKNMEVPRLT